MVLPHGWGWPKRRWKVTFCKPPPAQSCLACWSWPGLGLATSTDAAGTFRVSCPHGIDSLTLSCVGFDTQVVLNPSSHVDVWMEELQVMLGQAQVAVNRFSESEASVLDQPTLMQALDQTPGLQSLDLGAGMIQPVVRGLFGSRVAVLETAFTAGRAMGERPRVVVAPELQVATAWVPGGGHVWMGPEAVGGGLRFESPSRRNSSGVTTQMGLIARAGNLRGLHALHIANTERSHWHAGCGSRCKPSSATHFLVSRSHVPT